MNRGDVFIKIRTGKEFIYTWIQSVEWLYTFEFKDWRKDDNKVYYLKNYKAIKYNRFWNYSKNDMKFFKKKDSIRPLIYNLNNMFYNRWIAAKHWLWLALIVSYIQSSTWDIEIKDMRKELWITYASLLQKMLLQQEKWNIIWVWEPTKSWWYKKYTIKDWILDIKWPLFERKIK